MLDKKDQTILDLLKDDASLSTYQISKKTAIPQTTVLNRIKKLKQEGIINKFTVDIDYKKIDKKVKALIFAKVEKKKEKEVHGAVGDIESKIMRHALVINVKRLMGQYDFVMEVIAADIDELNQFLVDNIRKMDDIAETETVVVLKEWK